MTESHDLEIMSPRKFRCKVHGEVEEYIESTLTPVAEQVCQRCWWDWMVGKFGLMELLDD